MSIQIIDENKKFTNELPQYFNSRGLINAGLQYHTVAVFGSQSSGKSTLLNQLFQTEFDVMDTRNRRQTTHGIWLGTQKLQDEWPIVVLDVEGTDGRERGEDQDFERKAALFALATSEVLVVNMWENQIGLYFGSNMALLRTVFEVNLSLFQTDSSCKRSKILFVIRDYSALTPTDQLSATLKEDLDKQWASIAKPEQQVHSKVSDFFDVDYAFLPHKLFKPEEFIEDTKKLRSTISSSFNNNIYHRGVPIDGWPVYASQIWQKIEENKDLDLPSHHILVAKFRCEELSLESFKNFSEQCRDIPGLGGTSLVKDFGLKLSEAVKFNLKSFDDVASRYNEKVYESERAELVAKLTAEVLPWYAAQTKAMLVYSLNEFKSEIAKSKQPFDTRLQKANEHAREVFNELLTNSEVHGLNLPLEIDLNTEIETLSTEIRQQELKKIVKQVSKSLEAKLDIIDMHLMNNSLEYPWHAVLQTLENTLAQIFKEYPADLGLGGTQDEIEEYKLCIETLGWQKLHAKILQLTKPDQVLQLLREKFDLSFKYTDDGLPIVWNPTDDIDAKALKARQAALKLIPIFSKAQLNADEVLELPKRVAGYLENHDEELFEFTNLLSQQQQRDIEQRFQRLADQSYIEAKRSMMQSQTRIPTYIIVLLVVLGWNEFMVVLRNPLLLVLALMVLGGCYITYYLGMSNTVIAIIQHSFEQSIEAVKIVIRNLASSERTPSAVENKEE